MNQQFHIGDIIKFTRDGVEIEGRIKKLPQFNVAIVALEMIGVSAELTVNLDQAEFIANPYEDEPFDSIDNFTDILDPTIDHESMDCPFKINP